MKIHGEAPPSIVFTQDHDIIIWVDHDGACHTWWDSNARTPRDVAYALATIVDGLITDFDLGEPS